MAAAVAPETETPRAVGAFEAYWDLGPGRSLSKLIEQYRRDQAEGKFVPTTSMATLEQWSAVWKWQERILTRMASQADRMLQESFKTRADLTQRRLSEASALHAAGGQILRKILQRITEGDLERLPLVGHWEVAEFGSESYEQDFDACPVCQDSPAPQCAFCHGTGRRLTGKGRKKSTKGTRLIRLDGLMDLAPDVARLIALGHKLERTELGETPDSAEQLFDAIMNALPLAMREQVGSLVAAELAVSERKALP